MPAKCILVLLDGIADCSHPSLGHRTPLQAARTPHLDRVARLGANGLYHATVQGEALPSELAHFILFGYERPEFPGRGPLEALGAGIELTGSDVAVLAHLASLEIREGTALLLDDKPILGESEVAALVDDLGEYRDGEVRVEFRPTKGISGLLLLRGEGVSPWITDSSPMKEGRLLSAVVPRRDAPEPAAARLTAEIVTRYLTWVHRRLHRHPFNAERSARGLSPVNGLVTQRAGGRGVAEPFHRRTGLRGLIVASGFVYWGMGAHLGLDVHRVKDTEDAGRDLAERLSVAMASDHSFVHVHTKTPDEAAHRKDPEGKVAAIEALDTGLGRVLPDLLDDPEILLVVTADHTTPSAGPLIHSGETVPVTMCGGGVRRDGVDQFDEVAAALGALGPVRGRELLLLILNHLGRAKLQGIMDTPEDRPYWPGDYEPLRFDRVS